jgi:HEPN domain-containing protein
MNHLLTNTFKKTHVDAAVKHFNHMVEDFQKSDWEDSAAKGGKFIEAVLKALWVYAGEVVPKGKAFKAGSIIDQLANKATISDTIRQTIPRACRFAYEIASNRGARHDADEIDANEMDASAVLSCCSWILSEMVRFSQKALNLAQAKAVVDGLMKRRFPFSEEIDGRVYVNGESAPDVALLILLHIYPGRMSADELIASVKRHDHSEANAKMAVRRIGKYIDRDANGKLKLRATGLRKAESLRGAKKT